MPIIRRKTSVCNVRGVKIGGKSPIVIQSMTKTRTEDVNATVRQILRLEEEGCELIRVAVPNMEAAEKISKIKLKIHIPLAADIHFDCRLALASIKAGADKIRINPGNIGSEDRVHEILMSAKKAKTALRLGINAGSLEQILWAKYGRACPEALVESALNWIKIFEKNRFYNFTISIKSTDVLDAVAAYRMLAKKCDYPFHIGITEAGIPPYGSIKTAIGLGALLIDGIGDTIRASLTADPVEEIKICKMILKSLHLYNKEPEIISCPTCGRIEIDLMKMARQIEKELMRIKKPIKVSIIGCAVNGPGEAKGADWGIMGGNSPSGARCAIFKKGKILKWAPEKDSVKEFISLVRSTS